MAPAMMMCVPKSLGKTLIWQMLEHLIIKLLPPRKRHQPLQHLATALSVAFCPALLGWAAWLAARHWALRLAGLYYHWPQSQPLSGP
jgi:hypothetical protein